MSSDFYTTSILPFAGIIIKICRAYTDSQEDFEDYYQEVCLQIWRSREQFRGDSKWSTWIYRLSLNICLTLIKKKKNNRQHVVSEYQFVEDTEENQAFEDESLNQLYDAIKQLSEIDRAVILLYLEEKPNKDIAEIIGTTPNNIAVRVNRIKERLKKILDGKIN
ncbi:RNA polymerase sigma factor [Urechidicola vernalis]|uniref:Sigma-70 family RNA polymerase sigma factor n=1 Tax=Urechidicola vernalis TaxID=3075600 RepID=A0ABU2Y781_9FLAO|nr:sigma-70 family RNA polymerase sigma factor [Urechidicola sp. P050]MDT0553902.1 sigma-70 family RNA polymerase sigma factor [Urechidicola sp. P050]